MRKIAVVASLVATLLSTGAAAQDAYYWPATVPVEGQVRYNYFPQGTSLTFRMRTEANSKQMLPGNRVYLEVAEALTYQGQVVVPVGSPAVGEVVRVEHKGGWGKSGEVEIHLLYMQTPHGQIRLSGGAEHIGDSSRGWAIAGQAFLGIGSLVTGRTGRLRHSTVVEGYTDEPLRFVRQQVVEPIAFVQPDQARTQLGSNVFQGSGPKPGFNK